MIGPVHFVTGLPGNAKTLYTICAVKEKAEKENRPVYYNGIEILDKEALPWIEFEAHDWHKLPVGSIIVMDEAHKVFPVRPTGSKVPEHVTPIGELRHNGHDLFLITQDGMEIDSAVRRRCTTHLHCVRRLGFEVCAVREWPRFISNAASTNKGMTAQHEWPFNKEAYNWYVSAEKHTIKRRLPAKLLWLVAAALMIPVAILYMVHLFNKQRSGEAIKGAISASGGVVASAPAGGSGGGGQRVADTQLTPQQYAALYRPRVPGLAYTAQIYDQVVKPVRAPYPAACVESESKCQCYTGQGTRLDTTIEICSGIARGGFFVEWDEQKPVAQQTQQVRSVEPVRFEQAGTGLGGFDTTRVSSAEPVSVITSGQQDQPGRGRAIAR